MSRVTRRFPWTLVVVAALLLAACGRVGTPDTQAYPTDLETQALSLNEDAKLTAGDGAAYDYFGHGVALSGDTAVIEAFADDDNGTDSGSAYVFTRSGSTWTEQAKLTASDAAEGDEFGYQVALGEDIAVIGAHGDDDNGSVSGSAYVFKRSGTTWTEYAKLTASDGAANDFFGVDVALSDATVLVGAHLDDDNGTNSGSAYVFDLGLNAAPLLTVDTPTVSVTEGATATNTGTVSDPDSDPLTLSASIGVITDEGDGTWSWSYPTSDGPADSQTVTVTASDGTDTTDATFALTVSNVAPTLATPTVPLDPVDIMDQPVSVTTDFSDPAGAFDAPYTCTVDFDDGTPTVSGSVTGFRCQASHDYAEAGVYTVSVTITDMDAAATTRQAETYLVIYDPEGGFVTGGGWIDSPAGAYVADPTLTGKATFGFVSKYKKGANVPTGNTEFQFHAGDLNFHSDAYEWLVITGNDTARFKGSGTINGEVSPTADPYTFMLWAHDDDPDTFRIKLWYEDANEVEHLVYDNGFDQALGGGNVKVHKAK